MFSEELTHLYHAHMLMQLILEQCDVAPLLGTCPKHVT